MPVSLSLVSSLRPSQPDDVNYPRCFDIWTELSDSLEHHNLSTDYKFHPNQTGQLLTFTVPEVNQSQSCLIEYLPFKTGAFICLLLITLIALVGNITVIASLYSNRRRWSKVNYFIMHLAVADLAVLITPLVEIVTMLTHTWYGGRILCKLYRVLSAFGLYLSSFIVTSIAVDRYLAVSRPLSITTAGRRARMLLAMSLAAALLCSLPQAAVFDLYESSFFKEYNSVCVQAFAPIVSQSGSWTADQLKRISYALFAFGMMYGLPLLSIAWCYTRIVCVLSSRTREHRENCVCQQHSTSMTESVDLSRPQHSVLISGIGNSSVKRPILRRNDTRNIERARLLTLRMTAAIVLCFLLCWAPHWILTLWDTFAPNRELSDRATDLVYVGLACAFFNSCINPVIYGMFTKHIGRLISRRCSCLTKWHRRRLQQRHWHQQQQQQRSPFHYHQRQLEQQRAAACQYQMIPMQQLQRQFNTPETATPDRKTGADSVATATAAAAAAAAATASAAIRSSYSSDSASSHHHQQQQQSSASSSRRLDRNAFDKMFQPFYGAELSPGKV